jgi:hypothetical protein
MKAKLRASGRFQGGRRPFGWRLVPIPEGGAPLLVPDKAEQKAIAKILDMRKRGVTLTAICTAMHAQGHQLCRASVANIIDRAAGKPVKQKSKAGSVARTLPAVSLPEPEAAPASPNGSSNGNGSAVPVSLADVETLIRRAMGALASAPSTTGEPRSTKEREALVRLADGLDDIRALLRRDLLEIKRQAGMVETPKAPRVSRHRPLE